MKRKWILLLVVAVFMISGAGTAYWLITTRHILSVPLEMTYPLPEESGDHFYGELLGAIDSGTFSAQGELKPGEYRLSSDEKIYILEVSPGTTLHARVKFHADHQPAKKIWVLESCHAEFDEPILVTDEASSWSGRIQTIRTSEEQQDKVEFSVVMAAREMIGKLLVQTFQETAQHTSPFSQTDFFTSLTIEQGKCLLRPGSILRWQDSEVHVEAGSRLDFQNVHYVPDGSAKGKVTLTLVMNDLSHFRANEMLVTFQSGTLVLPMRVQQTKEGFDLALTPEDPAQCLLSFPEFLIGREEHALKMKQAELHVSHFHYHMNFVTERPLLELSLTSRFENGTADIRHARGRMAVEDVTIPSVLCDVKFTGETQQVRLELPAGLKLSKMDFRQQGSRGEVLEVELASFEIPSLRVEKWEDVEFNLLSLFQQPTSVQFRNQAGQVIHLETSEKSQIEFQGEMMVSPASAERAEVPPQAPMIQLSGHFPRMSIASNSLPDALSAENVTINATIQFGAQISMQGGFEGSISLEKILPSLKGDQALQADQVRLTVNEQGKLSLELQNITWQVPRNKLLKAMQSALPKQVEVPDVVINRKLAVVELQKLSGIEVEDLQVSSLDFGKEGISFEVYPTISGELEKRELFVGTELRTVGKDPLFGRDLKVEVPVRSWKTVRSSPFEVDLKVEGSCELKLGESTTLADQTVEACIECRSVRILRSRLKNFPIAGDLIELVPEFQDQLKIGGSTLPEYLEEKVSRTIQFSPWTGLSEDEIKFLSNITNTQLKWELEGDNLVFTGAAKIAL